MPDIEGEGESSDWFWNIIQRAEKDQVKLKEILTTLSRDEVRRFQEEFVDASAELQGEPFTDYMIKGSEDSVEDVSHWVVSQGREYYEEILEDPEKIPESVEEDDSSILYAVAPKVYRERFGDILDVY